MRITLFCSDVSHPVYSHLLAWKTANSNIYSISIISNVNEIKKPGDILFLISCTDIIKAEIREMFSYTLVLHASDLPEGRGWSPHIWDILAGKNELVVSLLDAEDKVDIGAIWQKKCIKLSGHELYDEINCLLFNAEIELISWACENISTATPTQQETGVFSYHRLRTADDSKVDVDSSIREQFNLLRVCDPNRYPAFFQLKGIRYKLIIEKYDEK
jgi:methionyl-tRNA formyltransferase